MSAVGRDDGSDAKVVIGARRVTTPETRRAPDGPGDALDLGDGIALRFSEGTYVTGGVDEADGQGVEQPHDDINAVAFLMVELSAADRAMVRALAERLARQ